MWGKSDWEKFRKHVEGNIYKLKGLTDDQKKMILKNIKGDKLVSKKALLGVMKAHFGRGHAPPHSDFWSPAELADLKKMIDAVEANLPEFP